MIEFTERDRPLKYFDDKTLGWCAPPVLEAYRLFDTAADGHPVYFAGWREPFMAPARYLNRILFCMIMEQCSMGTRILEARCYDGVLTACLSRNGFDAWMHDRYAWPRMWNKLGVTERAVDSIDNVDIFIMLNWLQQVEPEEVYPLVRKMCGGTIPALCIFDRNGSNRNPGMVPYYQDDILKGLQLDVVEYEKCKDRGHPGLQKDFLIHHANGATTPPRLDPGNGA